MTKKISELTSYEYEDLSELWDLETLLTKNVHILKLNLSSRENLVKEIKAEIKRISV